jgi:hypothetical protein
VDHVPGAADPFGGLDRLALPDLPADWVTAPGVDDPFAGPDESPPRPGAYPEPASFVRGTA